MRIEASARGIREKWFRVNLDLNVCINEYNLALKGHGAIDEWRR